MLWNIIGLFQLYSIHPPPFGKQYLASTHRGHRFCSLIIHCESVVPLISLNLEQVLWLSLLCIFRKYNWAYPGKIHPPCGKHDLIYTLTHKEPSEFYLEILLGCSNQNPHPLWKTQLASTQGGCILYGSLTVTLCKIYKAVVWKPDWAVLIKILTLYGKHS